MSCRRCNGGNRLGVPRELMLRGSMAARPEPCLCISVYMRSSHALCTATSPLCTGLKHMYDHGHPPPPRRYAFQWWLLLPSEGGAGPGLIDEPYAIGAKASCQPLPSTH